MDIIIFSLMFFAAGFCGGMLVGRWALRGLRGLGVQHPDPDSEQPPSSRNYGGPGKIAKEAKVMRREWFQVVAGVLK